MTTLVSNLVLFIKQKTFEVDEEYLTSYDGNASSIDDNVEGKSFLRTGKSLCLQDYVTHDTLHILNTHYPPQIFDLPQIPTPGCHTITSTIFPHYYLVSDI